MLYDSAMEMHYKQKFCPFSKISLPSRTFYIDLLNDLMFL